MLFCPISLVKSIVDVKIIFTRKKKRQSKRFVIQLSERDTDFVIGQSAQDEQMESRDNMMCRSTCSANISNPTQANIPRVDVHTLHFRKIMFLKNEMKWIK